jgi:DHA3 family macrolide efflux protein-like MFS transporter
MSTGSCPAYRSAPEVLGRVIALLVGAMSAAIPVGLLVAGPLAEAIGVARRRPRR